MLSLLLLSLILLPQDAFPAPLLTANNSTVETTGWRSEPPTRGTFRLIFSCLTTLTTCVYTAVHLNIPKENTSSLARYIEKSGWVVLGIAAPEFVVYTAWAQWHSARNIKSQINTHIDFKRRCSASGDQPSPERWTMTQAFYANMGGYVIDTKPLDGKEYIPGSPRITLTARGICFLAQSSIIPNEAESFIQDKSKANALAKVITCMQGGWLVIQCIARLAYQLPITLLEINTVGHVLCAFAIYLFWFSKPLDINEPTVISTVVSSEKLEDLERLCALMWMGSSLSSKAITRHLKASDADSELESLLFYGLRIGQFTGRHGLPTTIVKSPSEEKAKFKIYKSQILDGTGFTLNPQSSRFSGIQRVIELDDTDIQRWRMASRVLEKKLRPDTYKEPAHTFVGGRFRDLVCGRCWDWPGRDLVGGEDTLGLYLPLATALYGGLHSAAWNAYFPTSTERDWWRYSSIIAASSGSVFSALSILSYLIHRTTAAIHIRNSYLILSQSLIGLGGWGLMVAFFVSRMFLVIEAFISLRKLPLAAYDTPRWLQDIPHI